MPAVATRHTMKVMSREGDTRIIWSVDNADEVANARRTFDELKAKGFMAYSVKEGGDKGEVIRSFDPDVEMMILTPPMVGG